MKTIKYPLERFIYEKRIYNPDEIELVLKQVYPLSTVNKKRNSSYYINIPIAFDIETTTYFISEYNPMGVMYAWSLCVGGLVILGRKWEEYEDCVEYIRQYMNLSKDRRIIIYIHNITFDISFLLNRFEWEEVKGLKERTPMYALDINGIEYRCSYALSGYSLEKVGDNLQKFNIQKQVGKLNYILIRHPATPLSTEEIDYIINDTKVVVAYIQECMDNEDGIIYKIPYTQTGYIRREFRKTCLSTPGYRKFISSLTMTMPEYRQLKRAFMGGFTHCNPWYTNRISSKVRSYDINSSYPAVILTKYFPMSKATFYKHPSEEIFYKSLQNKCCLFELHIYGLCQKNMNEHYISESRCYYISGNKKVNNGRIMEADYLITTCTELDFDIINKMYKYDKIEISDLRVYKRGRLPTPFMKIISKYYSQKSLLKGKKGKEAEYTKAKELLNSVYGMCVTDPLRKQIKYTYKWDVMLPEGQYGFELLNKYNTDKSRFLFYPWGVWITAHARYNLFKAIIEFNNDYIYSDTDSVKVRNANKHKKFITEYNNNIRKEVIQACMYHKIPYNDFMPVIKGKEKTIGIWDNDGEYQYFKSFGAKRYITIDYSGNITVTISGLNKKLTAKYMVEKYKCIPIILNEFGEGLEIPSEYSGRLIHYYIDEPMQGIITDYLGNEYEYEEKSSCALVPTDINLSLAADYAKLIYEIAYKYGDLYSYVKDPESYKKWLYKFSCQQENDYEEWSDE